ncbi:MAG: DinB superfamily protein [Propionibacteriaceae bacterium]|jgi:uncharacterized damage-inducible protein DinB|nr:DinB superfamily protein [Propionibacteriaceae bacterium]
MPGNVPPVADERSALLAFLAHQRAAIRFAAHGLSDEQARMTPTVSKLTIGGLVKHVAHTERVWIDLASGVPAFGTTAEEHWAMYDGNEYELTPEESLEGVLTEYARVAARTEELVDAMDDLGAPVPVPKHVPWFPSDVDAWSVRWVLHHVNEETARHAGHADIIRESIDGYDALSLMALAEGWDLSALSGDE